MIKTTNLFFDYSEPTDDERILNNLNIEISAGEFVAILGHNGSGKSTLARQLNALLQPTEGAVFVNNLDTKIEENIWQIRQSTGMVFQNPDNQIIATIVEEDVAFGPENMGVDPFMIRKRVDEALESVGMDSFKKHAPHLLSGGQKQRLAIAGVLAMRPSCIILDEPTAMLDPSGRKEVMETIIALNKEFGITVILITHFMEEAAQADRILVMEAGKLILDDVPKKVFSNVELMVGLKLGVPPVTHLAHLLSEKGLPIGKDILTIDDFLEDPVIKKLIEVNK